MNWSSKEFIWLDWAVLVIGILGVAWAVWRAVRKDKLAMQGADSQDYLFGKGEPWYVIGAAIFAANIGSEHLVGLAGTGAKDGVGMAHWEMQGWMILILGWLFVPFYQLLNNKNRFMVEYHHIDCIYSYKSQRYSFHRRYLLRISARPSFLVGSFGTDCHYCRIYSIGRYERSYDNVCYSDTYPYHRLVPCTILRIICTWTWKHCRWMEQHDGLCTFCSRRLRNQPYVPLGRRRSYVS